MKLYSIKGNKLNDVLSNDFKLEKDIQSLIENNLDVLFNLQFVKSELKIKSFRFDTLGFDKVNKSFVIVEYKKDRNFSVIDQGYTYMSLMLNNKSDFILEYNENCGGTLKRDDVDWTQSKVIFISPNFTEYQKHSVNFRDVPFELWEIKRYENDLLGLVQHKTTSEESISIISDNPEDVVSKVSREVKVYSEEYHFKTKSSSDGVKELYQLLKERILNLSEVEMIPRKQYICFSRKTNFVDIEFQNKNLKLFINLKHGELEDPKGITRDISGLIGHNGNGDYEVKVLPEDDLDYIMFLINQSYKKQNR